jgi:hypothetical protein
MCQRYPKASLYIVTPTSDELIELAHAFSEQMRAEIAAERELRDRLRKERIRSLRAAKRVSTVLGGARGLKRRPLAPHPPLQRQIKTKTSPAEW